MSIAPRHLDLQFREFETDSSLDESPFDDGIIGAKSTKLPYTEVILSIPTSTRHCKHDMEARKISAIFTS